MYTHHAYLLKVADVGLVDISETINKIGVREVSYLNSDNLGIDEARSLIKSAYISPDSGEKKLLVVKSTKLTLEAQQALLKILEEPPATAVFLFVVTEGSHLLPTLQSRFFALDSSVEAESIKTSSDFKDFCCLDYAKRLEVIVKNLQKDDTVWLTNMKLGLTNYLTEHLQKLPLDVLLVLNMVTLNLNTRGASNKMLLEEIALILPVTAD